MFGSVVAPRKGKTHFVTIETSGNPIPLTDIFDSVFKRSGDSQHMNNTVFSFQYWNGNDVTVLVSKNAAKYRIQSNSFESMHLIVTEMIQRLEESDKSASVQYNEPYPLESYFAVIDEHFASRMKLKDMFAELRNRAQQFRSIQKRLLVRYKDKNPTQLNGLDVLFEQTFKSLLELAKVIEEEQANVATFANKLSSSTSLILSLARLKLAEADHQVLTSMLTSMVPPFSEEEHGWQEIVEANMLHLLRTSLAKSKQEAVSVPQPIQMAKDTRKLQKYIALVFDRLSKGGKLVQPEQVQVKESRENDKKKRPSSKK